MNTNLSHEKVNSCHLSRDAWLYVRQSTLRQVFENTESTHRQYALRQQAVSLGWPVERVQVIDCDLGRSAASEADREGFQRLVTEVSMGRAGIVLGLEVSRLARNSCDWHRLLEICAVTGTLILDEDGLYDPGHYNDRLLLGLKGTMSEAELHILRTRLLNNIESKARRGELKLPLPTGLVYDPAGHVVLDPDRQVQQTFTTFFEAFRRVGTACGCVKYFRQENLTMPQRLRCGERKGELVWAELDHQRALKILRNPRYAGAYVRGRTRTRKDVNGRAHTRQVPRDEWPVLLPDSHPGYIIWEQFEQNQQRLHENAQAYGADRRKRAPGEGPALLQGLAVCGVCGRPMTVRYRTRKHGLSPKYVCQREGIEHGEKICQDITGHTIDEAIGELLLELVSPLTLELAMEVQQQLQARLEQADRLRRQHVERARYEADLARQRFMQVHPDNRMVADSLEADWNDKLRSLTEAQQEYERGRQQDRATLNEQQRQEVMALVEDFPRLWHDERTPDRERKRMVRLLVEDATLTKRESELTVQVLLKGGATRTLSLPLPQPAYLTWQTDPDVVAQIDRLLDDHTGSEVAEQLNAQGLRSGKGGPFKRMTVYNICQSYGLKSRFERLRERGYLTLAEMSVELGVSRTTVKVWRRDGRLSAETANDKGQYLYEPLHEEQRPVKYQHRRQSVKGK